MSRSLLHCTFSRAGERVIVMKTKLFGKRAPMKMPDVRAMNLAAHDERQINGLVVPSAKYENEGA